MTADPQDARTKPPIEISTDLRSLEEMIALNFKDVLEIWGRARKNWRDGNKSQATADADVIRDVMVGMAGTILENTNCTFTIKDKSND